MDDTASREDHKLDVGYFSRRVSLTDHILPLPITLNPGESLRDAAYRAGRLNGCRSSIVIGELAAARSFGRLSAFISIADYGEMLRVCDVIGIRRDDRNLKTLIADANVDGREHVSFYGQKLRRAYISSTRRVSPRSLRIANFQRAVWSVRPLAFDPGTMEMLLERCPVCLQSLGWDTAVSVSACDQCGRVDLREFLQRLVEPDDEQALRVVCDIINPETHADAIAPLLDEPMRRETRGALFQFAIRIATTCQQNELGGRGTTGLKAKYLELAGRAILDWPNGFLDLSERIVASTAENRELGWFNRKPLRRLQFDRTLSTSIRTQIRALLDDARRVEAVRNSTPADLNESRGNDAAEPNGLQHPRAVLLRLLCRKTNTESGPGVGSYGLSDPTITAFRDFEQARRLSRNLGVSVPELWQLCRDELRPDILEADTPFDRPTVGVVERTLFRKMAGAIRSGMGDSAVSLVSCRFALDPLLTGTWSSIFAAIINGSLDVWRGTSLSCGLAANLYVNDFQRLKSIIQNGQLLPKVRDAPLTHAEVSMIFNKTRSVGADIVRSGEIAGAVTIGKLAEFRKVWAFGFELRTLAEINATPIGNVYRRLQQAGAARVTFGGVTVWQREKALSFLGLSKA